MVVVVVEEEEVRAKNIYVLSCQVFKELFSCSTRICLHPSDHAYHCKQSFWLHRHEHKLS